MGWGYRYRGASIQKSPRYDVIMANTFGLNFLIEFGAHEREQQS
jgi:hypothetical protein